MKKILKFYKDDNEYILKDEMDKVIMTVSSNLTLDSKEMYLNLFKGLTEQLEIESIVNNVSLENGFDQKTVDSGYFLFGYIERLIRKSVEEVNKVFQEEQEIANEK